jgi:hypothetical protein
MQLSKAWVGRLGYYGPLRLATPTNMIFAANFVNLLSDNANIVI